MLLLENVIVYTPQQKARALLIDAGRILAVGDPADLRQVAAGPLERLDLAGQVVLPGLTDAHLHLQHYALGLQKVDCDTPTRAECLRRVAERAASTPAGQWILGHGWNQNDWSEGFGSAADLDAAAPDHPVFLTARSLHAAWANSRALALAGVGSGTPDPPAGQIGRTPSGEPDGILFENAMGLLDAAIPEPNLDEITRALRAALPNLWRLGLTGVHDFDRQACFHALQVLDAQGALRLRVLKSLPIDALPEAAALGLRSGFGSEHLRIGGIKLFADGALGPHTAAMLQPYADDPQNTGMLFLDGEELFEHGRQASAAGLSLAVHAIGDRANHEMLAGFQQLRRYERENGLPHLPHRIEHVQLLHPADLGRLAELGLTASMQPIHATSDMFMADRFWGERSQYAYGWRTQLDKGASLVFGSDAPVESPNPWWGLYAAVTRRTAQGEPGPEGWYPAQRLSLEDALAAYTLAPARQAGWGDRLGQLAPGYWADLVVLADDPFTLPPEALRDIQPTATMSGGEWVFQR
jgi:predicted amidohydrolase YtcJ